MPTTRLTVTNVPTLEAIGGARTEWRDDTLSGFYLLVSPPGDRYPAGVRSFGLWYRVRGRAFRLSLGRHPLVGLAAARARAREILQAAALRGENIGRNRKAADLAALMRRWIDETAKGKAESTVAEERRMVRAYIEPSPAMQRPVPDLTRSDFRELGEKLAERAPIMANRVFTKIRTALTWAMDEDIILVDPSRGWKKPTADEPSRERFLHEAEIVALWQTCVALWRAGDELSEPALLLQFLLLTGQRSHETNLASEDDMDATVWLIPAAFRKGKRGKKRAHAVPLTPLATVILERARALTAGPRFFPRVNTVNNKTWPEDVRAIAATAGLKEHWTPHDLRRTVATGLAKLGVSRSAIALVLGHAITEGGAVTGTYDRFDRLPEKVAALGAWDASLARLISG